MRLANDSHSGPSMWYDTDMSKMDMFISVNEMGSDNGSKELWRRDWVELRQDKDCVLHRVCSNNHTVVSFGIPNSWSVNCFLFTLQTAIKKLSTYEVSIS